MATSEVCHNFIAELEISIEYEYCLYLIFLRCEVLSQSETIAQLLSSLWRIFLTEMFHQKIPFP